MHSDREHAQSLAEKPPKQLRPTLEALLDWLVQSAYPLWARLGYDSFYGGYHELLGRDGPIEREPRRARVQVRQIYAFARAASFGWTGDAPALVAQGWAYFFKHYLRPDGLFRTLVAFDGSLLDGQAFLYDQAFVLLALAETERAFGPNSAHLSAARTLRAHINRRLRFASAGFSSGVPGSLPLLSNPHMHLLEALQSWIDISDDMEWRTMADEIIGLALDHMIDVESGALLERFDQSWRALTSPDDRFIDPGHQFEWAWLLMRWSGSAPRHKAIQTATRLVEVGETHGLRRGHAILSLNSDLTARDEQTRLWSQAERLKAALALGRLTNQAQYWYMA